MIYQYSASTGDNDLFTSMECITQPTHYKQKSPGRYPELYLFVPVLGQLFHRLELEVYTYTQYAVGASEAIGNLHA